MRQHKNRHPRVAMIAGLAVGALLLGACGGNGADDDGGAGTDDTGGDSNGDDGASSDVTIRLFTFDDEAGAVLMREQLEEFTDETGIDVTYETLPGSGAAVYPDSLRTQILGGNPPDVWRIWGGQIGAPFAESGQAKDLSEYYDEFGWHDMLSEAAVDDMSFEGVPYGAPFRAAALGAWYNRELFEQAGVEEPTTYEELEEMNRQLVDAGITPLGTAGQYGWHIMRLFEYLLEVTAGPELHDQLLAGEASWEDPAVVEAFELFVRWQEEGWIPEGALGLDPSDVEPRYVQGGNAYTIAGQWTENNHISAAGADSEDFGTFVLPTGHEPERFSGFIEGFMIAEASPNPDEAAQLIDFLLRPETQRAIGNTQSAVLDAPPDAEEWPLSAQWAEIQAEGEHYVIQDQAFSQQLADNYFEVQSAVLQGNISPEDAAVRMEEYMQADRDD